MRARTLALLLGSGLLVLPACRSGRLGANQHVVDNAKLLKNKDPEILEMLTRDLLKGSDVDFVIVTEPTIGNEDLSARANRLFQKWHIGTRTKANRGLLLIIAEKEKQVRLHTSYEMEQMLTDGFISYIEHQAMVPYFERGYLGEGIMSATDTISKRIYEASLKGAYNPNQAGPQDISGFHAGGGGVENAAPILPHPTGPATQATGDVAVEFAAQPTPQQTWEKVLEWARRHIDTVNVGIFDEKTRHGWDNRPVTAADQDMMFGRYTGKTYEVRQQGDLAAIVYPDDPDHLLVPMFLKQTPEGWQMNGEMYSNKVVLDAQSRWRFITMNHPYQFAFKDFGFTPDHFAVRMLPDLGGYLGAVMHDGTILNKGVLLAHVFPDLAAARSGLEKGDIVLRYNQAAVNNYVQLISLVRNTKPGAHASVDIVRGAYPAVSTISSGGKIPDVFMPTTSGLHPPREMTVDVVIGQNPNLR